MAVGPEEFRDAARKFPSGITIVTVSSNGRLHGMTATAFSAVSLVPPRVLVCLEKTTKTRSLVLEAGAFAVNVLSKKQEAIARAFSRPGVKPFDDLTHRPGVKGAPVLEGSIAWFECLITDVVDVGDHDVVIGEVTACAGIDGPPLVYYDRDYRQLEGS